MGFFGIFKKSDKNDDSGDEKRHRKNKDQNEHKENIDESSQKPKKRKGTMKRLSSNSFKRIREIGICLRLIGDDLERRSLSGSQRNVNDGEQAKNQENINKNKENNDIRLGKNNANI